MKVVHFDKVCGSFVNPALFSDRILGQILTSNNVTMLTYAAESTVA